MGNVIRLKYLIMVPLVLFTCAMVISCDRGAKSGDKAMLGLFKGEMKTYVVSSPLRGALMKDGVPLANTTIIRHVSWNANEKGVEYTFQTDENGNFALPAHSEKMTLSPLTEFVSKTNLFAISEEKKEQFWFSSKHSGKINSEFEVVPEGLVCDLANPELGVSLDGLCLTKCVWSNMPNSSNIFDESF